MVWRKAYALYLKPFRRHPRVRQTERRMDGRTDKQTDVLIANAYVAFPKTES